MKTLASCISAQIDIGKMTLNEIIGTFEKREIKKGDFLLRAGKRCIEMIFVESGYLRMYDLADGREVTLWIAGPGKFVTSVSSFVFGTINHWNIQAVTDCVIHKISRQRHFELIQEQPKWLEFDNKLLAYSFALLERSMFAHLHTTAQERLESLMKEEPELFNRVPLQYIASMLGIAPESLSRLRKNLARSIS